MSKRVLVGALWFMAGSYLGSYVAYSSGLPDMLAPLTGTFGALLFAGDPFRIIWRSAPSAGKQRSLVGMAISLAHDGALAQDG